MLCNSHTPTTAKTFRVMLLQITLSNTLQKTKINPPVGFALVLPDECYVLSTEPQQQINNMTSAYDVQTLFIQQM